MSGVAGRSGSGGPRPGAGPPFQRFTLRLGAAVIVTVIDPDGGYLPNVFGEVTEVTRSRMVLKADDGTTVVITR